MDRLTSLKNQEKALVRQIGMQERYQWDKMDNGQEIDPRAKSNLGEAKRMLNDVRKELEKIS